MNVKQTPSESIFDEVFSSWSEACKASNSLNDAVGALEAFQTSRWIERQREYLSRARIGKFPRPTNLPLLAAALNAKSIVDFGGGSGWVSELLLKEKKRVRTFIVLEIPIICAEFSIYFKQNSNVFFSPSILDAPRWMTENTDIVYSNSVLQYSPDDSDLTKLVNNLAPEYLLIDDLVTSAGETFYSLQNYYEFKIPYRFSNLKQTENTFAKLGYELLGNFDFPTPLSVAAKFKFSANDSLYSKYGGSVSLLFKKLN